MVQPGRPRAHGRGDLHERDHARRPVPRLEPVGVHQALLTYDWLRVLIWFDHMGLRVATPGQPFFVGGDMASGAAAPVFWARAGRSRAIPEAIRRFGTWAPLLIPFYIPRGAEWDRAWTGAEIAARAPTPPLVGLVLGYALAALEITCAFGLFLLTRPKAEERRRAANHRQRPAVARFLWQRRGPLPRRERGAQRSADRHDPRARRSRVSARRLPLFP